MFVASRTVPTTTDWRRCPVAVRPPVKAARVAVRDGPRETAVPMIEAAIAAGFENAIPVVQRGYLPPPPRDCRATRAAETRILANRLAAFAAKHARPLFLSCRANPTPTMQRGINCRRTLSSVCRRARQLPYHQSCERLIGFLRFTSAFVGGANSQIFQR